MNSAQELATVLKERAGRYGDFAENARIAQAIKRELRSGVQWEGMTDDQRECLDQVVLKISRIVCGDPFYLDSWTDIEGYVRRVREGLMPKTNENFPA